MSRPQIDWDAIEPHYRAGVRALKDIGREFEVSDAAIIKHAKAFDWTRNLKAKIQAKADAKVSAAMVSAEVSAGKALTESARVEVEAEIRARIELSQRADVQRARKLVMDLLAELEAQTSDPGLFKDLGEAMASGEDVILRAAYERALSLAGRVSNMKSLADALKTLIVLERQAFKMDDEGGGSGGFERMLSEIHGAVT